MNHNQITLARGWVVTANLAPPERNLKIFLIALRPSNSPGIQRLVSYTPPICNIAQHLAAPIQLSLYSDMISAV